MSSAKASSASRIVAGSSADFVQVTHLRVAGSHEEIGRNLAFQAAAVFGSGPKAIDADLQERRRAWFGRHWPEYLRQSEGMAAGFGADPQDPTVYCEDLNGAPLSGGCSAVWSRSARGGKPGIVRNFDIHSSVIQVAPGQPGAQLPFLGRPHVIEMHPVDGLASVVITGNNLAGALEGINEAGLAVVELADSESTYEPTQVVSVGLNEGSIPRFILDRCRTAAEARGALARAAQYDRFARCHFLVADMHGDAFVWEHPHARAPRAYVAKAANLVVTNYLLAEHPDLGDLPANASGNDMFGRARIVHATVGDGAPTFADMHTALDAVLTEDPSTWSPQSGGVTVWRSAFDCSAARMTVRFLLGVDPAQGRRYSPDLTFDLR